MRLLSGLGSLPAKRVLAQSNANATLPEPRGRPHPREGALGAAAAPKANTHRGNRHLQTLLPRGEEGEHGPGSLGCSGAGWPPPEGVRVLQQRPQPSWTAVGLEARGRWGSSQCPGR